MRTGPIVTLEVAKQGAIYHGLATLLQQPSPVVARGGPRRMSEREGAGARNQADTTSITSSIAGGGQGSVTGAVPLGPMFAAKPPLPSPNNSQQLPNSKSTPALHHVGNICESPENSSTRSIA